MNNISIRKMRVFVAAVEEKSFSKAAIRENISQPAATIIANEIESTLGFEVFQRRGSTRKAELTQKGEFVAKTFSRIIAGYDMELHGISSLEGKKNQAKRILIQTSLANAVSGRWLASIAGMFSDCQVSFETAKRKQIIEEISEKEAILGVIDGRVENECSDYLHLGSYNLVAVRPMPRHNEVEAPVSALPEWLAIDDIDPHLSGRIRSVLKETGFPHQSVTNVGNISLLAQLMRETGAPAIIPDILLPTLEEMVPCRDIPLDVPPLRADFGVVTQWGHLAQLGRQRIKSESCVTLEAASSISIASELRIS